MTAYCRAKYGSTMLIALALRTHSSRAALCRAGRFQGTVRAAHTARRTSVAVAACCRAGAVGPVLVAQSVCLHSSLTARYYAENFTRIVLAAQTHPTLGRNSVGVAACC